MNEHDETLQFAEEYLNRGYSIIPLRGKVPPPGFRWSPYQRWRTKHTEIHQWFGTRQRHRYDIGIVTGQISGLAVIDIDSPNDIDWWKESFPVTPLVAITGRGGAHMYYRSSPTAKLRNRTGLHGRKIDFRGEGGYVVAPPSIHVDTGKTYCWQPWEYSVEAIPVIDPLWLESAEEVKQMIEIQSARPSAVYIRNGAAYIAHIRAVAGQGGHNATFRAACALRDAGMTPDQAFLAMLVWNETNCVPMWKAEELAHKVSDAFRSLRN